MRKGAYVLVGLVLAVLVSVLVVVSSTRDDAGVWVKSGPVQWVEEDSPMWDCHTMGNGVCGSPEVPSVAAPSERIEEDDPRWDCRTMGNLRCGKSGE